MAVFILQVVLATCLLGIAIDVVTANVAVEYFTVYHPHVVDSNSPWVMALVWGVGASWWFGAIASVLLWWINIRRPQPLSRMRVFWMAVKGMIVQILENLISNSVYWLDQRRKLERRFSPEIAVSVVADVFEPR